MDKGRPFTFLDHALKCGKLLVGTDEELYRKWAYSLKGEQFTLYLTTLEEIVATTRQKRKELESFTVLNVRDAEHKAGLLKEADEGYGACEIGLRPAGGCAPDGVETCRAGNHALEFSVGLRGWFTHGHP